jgi:hypothetical protein
MSSHRDFAVVPEGVAGIDLQHPCKSGAQVLEAEAGLVERRRDKIAIVGYATSSRDLAPFDDPEWEIIGLNQLYRFIPRADFWADLHVNWYEENVEGTDHEGWLRGCGIPVLMTQRVAAIPTSVRFPIDEIIGAGTDYLTSTIALLIAWSIHQGYKEIGLYGIDLVVGTEYAHQKACAEFWLGVAHGRGITVRIPPQSALLKHTHRYGYEKEPDTGIFKPSELDARHKSLTEKRDAMLTRLRALDGAIGEATRVRDELATGPVTTVDAVHAALDGRVKALGEMRHEAVFELATIDGAVQEELYLAELMRLRLRGVFHPITGA